MTTLRMALLLAVCAATAVGCGDDDRPPVDGGRDGGTLIFDSGPRPDRPPTDGPVTPGMCGGDTCDLLTGGGCGTGMSCQFLAPAMGEDPVAMCVMAGTAGDGMPCMTYTDCQEGFACVIPGAGPMGTCQHYCCPGDPGASGACPTGQSCSTNFADTDVGFCSFPDDCDPIMQTGCGAGEACYPGEGGTYRCATPLPGAGGAGATCGMFVNECLGGHACIDGTCRELCNRPAGAECDSGTMCAGLSGFETLGVCVMP